MIGSIRFVATMLLLGLLHTATAQGAPLPASDPKVQAIEKVYNRIARAFGDSRQPPQLLVQAKSRTGKGGIAYYFPGTEGLLGLDDSKRQIQPATISIDEQVFDLFATYGAERDNALAVLLAHELTHFYHNHGWLDEFGKAFAETDLGRQMREQLRVGSRQEVIRLETDADYFGGFYGYLAGYDTLGIADRVLETVYTTYGLKQKSMASYPSLAERKLIAEKSAARLRSMIPLFDIGNHLLVLQRYEEAARLFDFLARSFPSREMFNNAGVAYASAALHLAPPPFTYPLAFDTDTHLQHKGVRTTRGDTTRIQELFARAADNFDRAIQRDPSYATAFANRAATFDLLGDPELALIYANRALSLAATAGEETTRADASVIRGIVFANLAATAPEGQKTLRDKALADFAAAEKVSPVLAAANTAQLTGSVSELGFAGNQAGGEIVQFAPELLAGMEVRAVLDFDFAERPHALPAADGSGEMITFYQQRGPGYQAFYVDSTPSDLAALITASDYAGASARGIKLGASLAAVEQAYGRASRIVSARQGTFLCYESSQMVFAMTPQQTVKGWMIYQAFE